MHIVNPVGNYLYICKLMENGENRSTYGDVASHYNNIFNTSEASRKYTSDVYNEFLNAMYQ